MAGEEHNKEEKVKKKRKRYPYTAKTIRYLQEQGYEVGKVEAFNPFARKRIDLFGIIDLVAIGGPRILGVQSCGQNFAEHDRTILASPYTKLWLKGGDLVLIGWRKVKKVRGGKAMVWKERIKYY